MSACAAPPEAGDRPVNLIQIPLEPPLAGGGSAREAQHWSSGVSAVGSDRPQIPNAGLQLPTVSPDGRWVAYLDHDRDSGRIGGESWITGRGLDAVSLWVRRVESDGLARNVAVGHAAWPTWSEDGKTLLFISHDPRTGGGLGLHDLETGITRRISAGLNRMFAPGISPSGRYVAVSGYGAHADDAVLFLIDLTTGRAEPGPVPVLGVLELRQYGKLTIR